MTQNFVFSVKFDTAAQYDWITAATFAMAFDLFALSAVKILIMWTLPKFVLVIAMLVLLVGSVVFGTFCGDETMDDGTLVVLECSLDNI